MNIPVLNIWDETQKKYVGIPAITSGDTGGVNEDILNDAIDDAINNALTDVSSQIQAHNNNINAHTSIRALITNALNSAKAYTDTEIAEFGESMKPLTYDYMPEGYPYVDPVGGKEFIYSVSGKVNRNYSIGNGSYSTDLMTEPLILNETYIVTFDGVDYESVCLPDMFDDVFLGNRRACGRTGVSYDDDPDVPFCVCSSDDRITAYAYNPQNGQVSTCTINKAIPVAVPMDEKFLPDSVKCANAPAVEELSESATVLVEDGGEVKRVAKDKVGGGSGGGGTFIINITEWGESEVRKDTGTQYHEYKRGGVADKTYEEIENAFNSGMVVMVCLIDAYSESGAECVSKGFYNLEAYMTNSIQDVNNYFTFSCFYADYEGAGKTSITIRKNGEVEYDDYWGAYAGGGEA